MQGLSSRAWGFRFMVHSGSGWLEVFGSKAEGFRLAWGLGYTGVWLAEAMKLWKLRGSFVRRFRNIQEDCVEAFYTSPFASRMGRRAERAMVAAKVL